MQFYFLEVIPESVGQVEEIDNINYDRIGPHGYTRIPLEGKVPPNVVLPTCFLSERSQPTDFLNVVPFGYLFLTISSKVMRLIENLEIDYHSVLDTEIIDKRINLRYHYHGVHFPWFRNELYIDWEKTTFTIKEAFEPVGEIQFDNYIEYRQWRNVYFKPGDKSSKSVFLKDLFLKNKVINKDLFILNDTVRTYIASERLKTLFELHDISGVQFIGEFINSRGKYHSIEPKKNSRT